MSELNRREAVKLAAGLAACGGALVAGEARGNDKLAGDAKLSAASPEDSALEQAVRNPAAFMFREQVMFKLEGDGHSRDLYITSAKDADGKPLRVRVPSAAVRIFRADASVDDFTRNGGVYWQFFGKKGKFQLKDPGALVMIVREHDDTVRCYSLIHDMRC